jgi:hypothetical protein
VTETSKMTDLIRRPTQHLKVDDAARHASTRCCADRSGTFVNGRQLVGDHRHGHASGSQRVARRPHDAVRRTFSDGSPAGMHPGDRFEQPDRLASTFAPHSGYDVVRIRSVKCLSEVALEPAFDPHPDTRREPRAMVETARTTSGTAAPDRCATGAARLRADPRSWFAHPSHSVAGAAVEESAVCDRLLPDRPVDSDPPVVVIDWNRRRARVDPRSAAWIALARHVVRGMALCRQGLTSPASDSTTSVGVASTNADEGVSPRDADPLSTLPYVEAECVTPVPSWLRARGLAR